jgi:hypothetical protein
VDYCGSQVDKQLREQGGAPKHPSVGPPRYTGVTEVLTDGPFCVDTCEQIVRSTATASGVAEPATNGAWYGYGVAERRRTEATNLRHHPDRRVRSQASRNLNWLKKIKNGKWYQRLLWNLIDKSANLGNSRWVSRLGKAIPVVGAGAIGVGTFSKYFLEGDSAVTAGAKAVIVTGFSVGLAGFGAVAGGACGPAVVVCAPLFGAAGGVAGGFAGEGMNWVLGKAGVWDFTNRKFSWP